ncbi:MAG TPA: LysR family transcriptional regulator [Candidatus Hydrogenedentes bacterium]|nr:LysR family transcriptional regulator [Candidatus Hydrogenedentota bacterium]HPU96516.1 LysR family transcriptional regulator [Candidatus Hydrogenedentota bacterium]
MNIEWLRYFCAVVESGSFKQAARKVYKTQPAVSMGVQSLEKMLGQTLIDRKTGQATPAGTLLYERARALLRHMDDLRREMADLGQSESMALRIGASDTTAIHLLPPLLRQFRDIFPDTAITMVSRSSEAVAGLVAEGILDLGLVTLPESRGDLEVQPLFSQRLVFAIPNAPGFHFGGFDTTADLSRLPMILLEEHTRAGSIIRNWLAEKGITVRPFLTCGSFEVIRQYIAEKLGTGFLPEEMADADAHPRLKIHALEDPPAITIGVVRRRDGYLPPRVRAFLEILQTATPPSPSLRPAPRSEAVRRRRSR